MYKTNESRISFERVSDAKRSICGFIRMVRTHYWRWVNAFGFSFEHIWLVVRTRQASHSNEFGFSFERVWMRPGCRSNAFGQKRVIPCDWREFRWTNIKFLCEGCASFRFVCYTWQFSVMLTSWEHAVYPLSGIKKRLLVRGWFTTSSIVNSIGAIASVRYGKIVRWREGTLWEVPL